MPIKVEPSGAAELYGGLARLAGESIAAQKEMERAERNAQALREHQWEMEKIELGHQWNIEAYNRSQAWEIEKADMASRVDFEQEERKRRKEIDEFEVTKDAIMKSTRLSPKEKELFILQALTNFPLVQTYMKPEKATFTPAQIEKGKGELSKYIGIKSKEEVINGIGGAVEMFGPDFEQTAPGVMEYINQKFPEIEPTAPTEPKKTWGWPTLTQPAYRVRPETSAIPATSVRMQFAPDVALDSYWPNLTNEQKEKVWAAFNNGYTPEEIIASLGVR